MSAAKALSLADYRYIFVVTYPRSGSTLLMHLLNQAPGVCLRGENEAALAHLFKACQAIAGATKRKRVPRTADTDNPWFGVHDIKPQKFRGRLLNSFVATVLTPPAGTHITGFKEVRHGPHFMNDTEFADYVDFLLSDFPGARIVFNTRNAGDVSKSGFFRERPSASVLKTVETCDRRFAAALAAHPDRCFHVSYERFVADPDLYEGLFSFLDLPYDAARVAAVLDKPLVHAQGRQTAP